jgi:hypothetical protein
MPYRYEEDAKTAREWYAKEPPVKGKIVSLGMGGNTRIPPVCLHRAVSCLRIIFRFLFHSSSHDSYVFIACGLACSPCCTATDTEMVSSRDAPQSLRIQV